MVRKRRSLRSPAQEEHFNAKAGEKFVNSEI